MLGAGMTKVFFSSSPMVMSPGSCRVTSLMMVPFHTIAPLRSLVSRALAVVVRPTEFLAELAPARPGHCFFCRERRTNPVSTSNRPRQGRALPHLGLPGRLIGASFHVQRTARRKDLNGHPFSA